MRPQGGAQRLSFLCRCPALSSTVLCAPCRTLQAHAPAKRRQLCTRARALRVTLIEAREVLGSFFPTLREYAARRLVQQGVQLRKGVVKSVSATELTLQVCALRAFAF